MSPFKSIGDCFKLDKQVQSDLLRSQILRKQWTDIVGKQLASHLCLDFIRADVCIISVSNPCWYSEIKAFEKDIILKINKALGKKKHVKRLKLTISK